MRLQVGLVDWAVIPGARRETWAILISDLGHPPRSQMRDRGDSF